MRKKPQKQEEPFDAWVKRNGGEWLAPTNEWEEFRFKAYTKTHIIYRKKKGKGRSYSSEEARDVYGTYTLGEDMRLNDRVDSYLKGEPVIRALVARDGPRCFYCNVEFSVTVKPTIEHLVARVHQGPDHMANKLLACQPCNEEAGHLSGVEKIRLRDAKLWN